MSKLRGIAQQDRYFFVTTNIAADVRGFSPSERTLILKSLSQCREKLAFKVFAYVAMPSHAHILLEPMENELSSVVRSFKSDSARKINYLRATNGPLGQRRFFDAICRHVKNFSENAEYIHRNPVEAGLAKQPEHWKWSSASQNELLVPDFIAPADPNTLLWPAPWR